MNGSSNDSSVVEKLFPSWDLAMNVSIEDIVYLHCHQSDQGGKMVLVGHDGVQMPPMIFPRGGHLLAFLACLESGLDPVGRLDPPLENEPGIGKIFPKTRLRKILQTETEEPENDDTVDYVFRVLINCNRPDSIRKS